MALPKSNGKLVLITGVNGYIAAQTARAFLEAGYSVRGTVRSHGSSKDLLDVLKRFAEDGRLEIVEVKDITLPGAFDEAVKGVHAIGHMASPVSMSFTDPEPVIKAAVGGTKSILASAKSKAGPQLKSVVVTSSIVAIRSLKKPPYTLTESDWNTFSEGEVSRLGSAAPGPQIYSASKTAAERAFWEFKDVERPTFDMSAINPVFVIGPALKAPSSPDKIGETPKPIWYTLTGQEIPPPFGGTSTFVDVRDVSRLMVFAVQYPEITSGERYIACGGLAGEQAQRDILRAQYPDRHHIIKIGEPGKGYRADYRFPEGVVSIDNSKAVKATGQDWIPYDQSVIDTAKSFEHLL
ncbi:NAD(P)-binding protein [Patellaria atrata CBS 101060]|uniref:NAD(P)-binding protein n=1 Tax=Patellaria atrata CBS 101060 TaxID=1346257 RepID=A0A9P4VSM0_9PEZI|nr:NAD(P)-binding protein [Patellaria atrata CBS 101060]